MWSDVGDASVSEVGPAVTSSRGLGRSDGSIARVGGVSRSRTPESRHGPGLEVSSPPPLLDPGYG